MQRALMSIIPNLCCDETERMSIHSPDTSLWQSQVSGEWVLLIDNGVVVVSFQKHRLRWEWWWGWHVFPNENCRLFSEVR